MNFGSGGISEYISTSERQVLATYAAFPDAIAVLDAFDRLLCTDAEKYMGSCDERLAESAQLLMRAYTINRTACRLAFAGQLYETTILLRSLIECGVYAWACSASEDHRLAWRSRGDSSSKRGKSRDMFQWGALMRRLNGVAPSVSERCARYYEDFIDFGAHPNVQGIALSSQVSQPATAQAQLETIHMHGYKGVWLCLLNLIGANDALSHLVGMIFADRFKALGLDSAIVAIRLQVLRVMKELERQGHLPA